MAKDETIKAYIGHYKEYIKNAKDDDDLERSMMLFAKDVERSTRHAAADLATKLANDITNL